MADRIAVVTGASSGIGAELAAELAGRGYTPWLVARREDRLNSLAASIGKDSGRRARVVPLDLTSAPARKSLVEMMRAEASAIALFVNNAGFGAVGPTLQHSAERYSEMIALNIEALTEQSLEAAKIMVSNGSGGIINVASIAAFQPIPWMNTYSATKAFVLHFSEGLAHELKDKGVRVMALCPGYTRTEFQEVAGVHGDDPRMRTAMSARDCARAAWVDFERGKTVSVPGTWNRVQILGTRLLPRRAVVAVTSRFMRDHS